jgi:hypothetical protein
MLPRRITQILKSRGNNDTKPPMHNDCCGAIATRRPWRTKGFKSSIGHIKNVKNPGGYHIN